MNKKEIEIGKRSFAIIEKCEIDLLSLCDGQPVSLAISILIASADKLLETAKEIRECYNERKDGWDLIRDVLRKP